MVRASAFSYTHRAAPENTPSLFIASFDLPRAIRLRSRIQGTFETLSMPSFTLWIYS